MEDVKTVRVPALDAIPGLVHGFEQRRGAPTAESRDESRARVTRALAPLGRLYLLKQVHGTTLHTAPWTGYPVGDGGIAPEAGQILGIETADCLPVLIVDPRRRVTAAVHAGWRGTAAHIALKAARTLIEQGSRAEDLLAALGPGNGPCCYEVGEELRQSFPGEDDIFSQGPSGKAHLDVRAANRKQLLTAGLREENVHSVLDCTHCLTDLYHSYRREGVGGGRMISFVGFAEAAGTRPAI